MKTKYNSNLKLLSQGKMLTVIKFSALTVIPIYIIMLTLNIYNVKIHFSDSKTVKLKTECE